MSTPPLHPHERAHFARHGYVILRELLDPETEEALGSAVRQDLGGARSLKGYTGQFRSLTYTLDHSGALLEGLCENAAFAATLADIVDDKPVFTQGVAFALQPDARPGLGWHFGISSFCFTEPDALAFSLWMPFTPI
ncbi:MAG: hypothetical protein KC620_24190, partial [Myxococcales bacterium]|nr:hypothetical protein [Myxococcales bacterium]